MTKNLFHKIHLKKSYLENTNLENNTFSVTRMKNFWFSSIYVVQLTVHLPPISNLISVIFIEQLSSVPNVISRRAKQKKILIRNQKHFNESLAQICTEWRWSWQFHLWAVRVRSFKMIWEKAWRSAPQWSLLVSCAIMYFSPCLLFIFIHLAVSIKLIISSTWIQIQ